MTLIHFLEFLEREEAEFITSELALRWAMEPKLVQRATWARRLGMVATIRLLAQYNRSPHRSAATAVARCPPTPQQAAHLLRTRDRTVDG
jgi:hypothetical protein